MITYDVYKPTVSHAGKRERPDRGCNGGAFLFALPLSLCYEIESEFVTMAK